VRAFDAFIENMLGEIDPKDAEYVFAVWAAGWSAAMAAATALVELEPRTSAWQ
jgi:hypothetical protein